MKVVDRSAPELRFPRLERLLETRLSDADAFPAEAFDAFVERQVEENFDIDFKSWLYPRKKKDGEDGAIALAIDVAAFANSQGGVIVLGVKEENGVAVGLSPVAITDDEHRRMTSAILALVTPVPEFQIWARQIKTQPDRGYYVIAVPASPHRPHAVRTDSALLWPRREGRQNRYLAETEIADAYRNRFADVAAQEHHLDRVMADGLGKLDLTSSVWIALALVPNVPGFTMIRRDFNKSYVEWLGEQLKPYLQLFSENPTLSTDVRRVTVIAWPHQESGLARRAHAELHTDGAGFVAACLDGPEQPASSTLLAISAARLVVRLLEMVRVVVGHARMNTGTYGDAAVEARLVTTLEADHQCSLPIALVTRGLFGGEIGRRRLLSLPRPSRHTLNLDDVLDSTTSLLLASRAIALDVVQAFGVADLDQIDADGRLGLQNIDDEYKREVTAWAQAVGAETA